MRLIIAPRWGKHGLYYVEGEDWCPWILDMEWDWPPRRSHRRPFNWRVER